MIRGATLSADRRYRYTLARTWEEAAPFVAFIGLNPSTADESADDPTIRRCIGFAKAWGYGGLVMLNLFAFRATNPDDMLRESDPCGEANFDYLDAAARRAEKVIACWGAERHQRVALQAGYVRARVVSDLHFLRLNKDGSPAHPLYLPGHLTPQPWGTAALAAKDAAP